MSRFVLQATPTYKAIISTIEPSKSWYLRLCSQIIKYRFMVKVMHLSTLSPIPPHMYGVFDSLQELKPYYWGIGFV